jgi:hypothetical protein
VHILEVGEHDLSVEAVAMHIACVLHDGVSDDISVASANAEPTARTCLRVDHDRRFKSTAASIVP